MIAPSSGSLQVVEGGSGQFSFTVTTTGLDGVAVVPVVGVDAATLELVGPVDSSISGQYTVRLATVPGLAPGAYQGQVRFRVCADAACGTEYLAAARTFSYAVTVALADWATFQRDAGHTGFVNVQLDPAKFTTLWSWSRPAGDPEPVGGINAVATGGGRVFVSKDVYFGQGALYALNETDGTLAWTYALGPMVSQGPPAFADGRVIVPSTDASEQCTMWAVDAANGAFQFRMPSTCQWSNFFAPTPLGGSILQTSQAGAVYSFSATDGSPQWSVPAEAYDQSTPAADGRYVYQYGTAGSPSLSVFDKLNGARVASIADPFSSGFSGYSMFSAPMLGTAGDVISFSGGGFSGRAASSSEQGVSRVLVSYDVGGSRVAWRSANAYQTHPAIAGGVIYAARNSPAALDALSEVDGRVLWSWALPAGDASFHRNIVLTRNLVFVSTDANTYAIDLTTHQSVWQYPRTGMLAISAGAVLYIVTGATISDGQLVAIRLK